MTDRDTNFATACYDTLSIDDLAAALAGTPDETSMRDWQITEDEYFAGIEWALHQKTVDDICSNDAWAEQVRRALRGERSSAQARDEASRGLREGWAHELLRRLER